MINVYQMYEENDHKAGFWLSRTTWGDWIALVKIIQGKAEGPLEGCAPYYGTPPVIADVYNRHTGELLKTDFPISCPGTYSTYYPAEAPDWAKPTTGHDEVTGR